MPKRFLKMKMTKDDLILYDLQNLLLGEYVYEPDDPYVSELSENESINIFSERTKEVRKIVLGIELGKYIEHEGYVFRRQEDGGKRIKSKLYVYKEDEVEDFNYLISVWSALATEADAKCYFHSYVKIPPRL